MLALQRLREMESVIDLRMVPIEDAVRLLQKYKVPVDRAVAEAVEILRYQWSKVKDQAAKKQEQLNASQVRSSPEVAVLILARRNSSTRS